MMLNDTDMDLTTLIAMKERGKNMHHFLAFKIINNQSLEKTEVERRK